MTAHAPTLFDAPTTGTFRRSDPPTSVAAAQSLDPATMHIELRRVYAAIARHGDHGATAGEITRALAAEGHDRQRNCISRRVTDLVDGGLVRRTDRVRRLDRKGARDETVWQVTRAATPAETNRNAPALSPQPGA